jgi:hypothetical protein
LRAGVRPEIVADNWVTSMLDVTRNVYVLLGFAFRFVPSCFGFMISSGAELFLR